MKIVRNFIIAFIATWVFYYFIGGSIVRFLFPVGDPIKVSYHYYTYFTLTTLSALVVACTTYLADLIKSVNTIVKREEPHDLDE